MGDERIARRTIAAPVNCPVPVITLLGWMSKLDVVIAAELDVGRVGMAKELRKLSNDVGRQLPSELGFRDEDEAS